MLSALQLVLSVNSIEVKIEGDVGARTVPFLITEMTFQADVKDWSSKVNNPKQKSWPFLVPDEDCYLLCCKMKTCVKAGSDYNDTDKDVKSHSWAAKWWGSHHNGNNNDVIDQEIPLSLELLPEEFFMLERDDKKFGQISTCLLLMYLCACVALIVQG